MSTSSVIIIGAGISGITAAKELAKNGVEDVMILEATERIGGRIQKESFGDVSVELGAGWIAGVGGKESNPVWELASRLNLRTCFSDYTNARYNIYDRSGEIFPTSFAADSYKKAVDSAILKLKSLEAECAGQETEETPSSPETPIDLAIDFILHDFEMAEVEPISTYVDFGEREYLVADERGYESLLYKMAEGFLYTSDGNILDNRLKLNKVVREVQQSRNGVVVKTEDGSEYEANYVIVSASIGVLQSNLISFHPPLPKWKTEAIQECDVMVYTKIFLKFPNCFWPCGPGQEFFIYAHEQRGYFTFWQVNKYYDLATSFYEYGWGESFHFAHRWNGESLRESIKRHEHFLALQLGVKPGQKVLDVGCGIGGPLREIARFSNSSVTGINNNEYQITRGKELNRLAGVDKTCNFVKADFMKMPFPENTFDAVYAIEATCHAPDAYGCYKEIYRVLKPGKCFAAYEWCMTDAFDPDNAQHQKIKAEIEIGDGLPDIRLTSKCLEALKQAGFEVIWEKDLAKDSPVPWYLPLDKNHFSLSSFRLTAVGRFITKNMVKILEYIRLAPKGSQRVSDFLEKAAEGLVDGGRREIFTPMYFFLARKPE